MDRFVLINSEDLDWIVRRLRASAALSDEELARLKEIAVEAELEEPDEADEEEDL
jgi:uncharacterized protein HemY